MLEVDWCQPGLVYLRVGICDTIGEILPDGLDNGMVDRNMARVSQVLRYFVKGIGLDSNAY